MNILTNNDLNPHLRIFQLKLTDDTNYVFKKRESILTGIGKWVNFFQQLDLNPNPSVGLSIELDPDYFCVFAALVEIGANFVILDSKYDEQSSHKLFLPLDLVIYDKDTVAIKMDDISYWKHKARMLIDIDDVEFDDKKNSDKQIPVSEFAAGKQHNIMLSSTTSGSTGKKKPIVHTYQYILDVSRRNARVLPLNGRVAHITNLHHGSSLPVFFLPSLTTADFHWCAPWGNLEDFKNLDTYIDTVLKHSELFDINHILFPFSHLLEKFLQAVLDHDLYFSNLKLYTLTYIKPAFKKYIEGKNIEIISVFGCTETSGPIMINRLSNSNMETFDPKVFYTLDDFFKVTVMSDGTLIESSNQLVSHLMKDKFEQLSPNSYKHLGRSDIFQINDKRFPVNDIMQIPVDLALDSDIIIDYVNEKLYLAVWDQSDLAQTLFLVNEKLEKIDATGMLRINQSSTKNLDKSNFLSGIKIDSEKLRKYFSGND